MAEPDFEIEYLDEDEDVVQQCVQNPQESLIPAALSTMPESKLVKIEQDQPLLVERVREKAPTKRKRKKEDEDSDYNPKDDNDDDDPPPTRRYNKRKTQTPTQKYVPTPKYTPTPKHTPTLKYTPTPKHTLTPKQTPTVEPKKYRMSSAEELQFRKDLNVKIPNFEDPLCLPVKAAMKDEAEMRKVLNWNNLCLNNFKNYDTSLKPDGGETIGSQRSVVLRNVRNKLTGKSETTVWSKMTVHSKIDKKTEVFQSILPKYREAKVLDFPMSLMKRNKPVHIVDTVVLTKEEDKGDVLVVYKPKQALSAVYRLMEESRDESVTETKKDDEKKQYLRELTVSKVCAPCFQGSWRGFRKTVKKKSVMCPICVRTFVSVYNLLAHVKTHSAVDVRNNKRLLNKTLSNVVEYHYKCRICQEKCASIRELRKHVVTHQSTEQFQCEICNRTVKNSFSA